MCETCAHWARNGGGRGDCRFLSGKTRRAMLKNRDTETYPDINVTGIESYPICQHDGMGFTYETLATFGCVHHKQEIEKSRTHIRLINFDQLDCHGVVFVRKSVDEDNLNQLIAEGKIDGYTLTDKYLDVWFT